MNKNFKEDWIHWTASHYHSRDIAKFEDGSLGTFTITHEQFKRELAQAYRRGQAGDDSIPEIQWPRETWRRPQEKVR